VPRASDTLGFENPDRGLLGWILVEKSKMFSSFRIKDGADEMNCQAKISNICDKCRSRIFALELCKRSRKCRESETFPMISEDSTGLVNQFEFDLYGIFLPTD
jgi:hypothetical protein